MGTAKQAKKTDNMKTREELKANATSFARTYYGTAIKLQSVDADYIALGMTAFAFEEIEAYKAEVMDAIAKVESDRFQEYCMPNGAFQDALDKVKEAITKQ